MRRWVPGFAVSVAWAVGAACGGGGYRLEKEIGERPWHELRSAHFVMRTDVDLDRAERRLAGLEAQYAALGHAYGLIVTGRPPPSTMTEVLLFEHCVDLERVVEGAAGFVARTPDFRSARWLVTCEAQPLADEVLMHELAHVMNAHYLGAVPLWLSEGLASYFQTLAVEDGQIVLGRFGMIGFVLGEHRIPVLLEKLLAADHETFRGPMQPAYYHAARSLVHLLNNGSEDYHRRFQRYLALLGAGEDRGRAWSEAFAGVSMEKLGDELHHYHETPAKRVWRLPFTPPAAAARVTASRLSPGEAHATWVQAQLVRGRFDVGPLGKQLELAARQDPGWRDLAFWQAVLETRRTPPDPEAAIRLLEDHLAAAPDDERAHIGLVYLLLQRSIGSEAVALETLSGLEPLERDVRELARVADTAAGLNLVAWYFALRRMPEVGLGFARRALAAEPACATCEDTLALLLHLQHRDREALAAQERAVQMMGEAGPLPSSMLARLAAYRKAVKDKENP